jgi:hypothetical protein
MWPNALPAKAQAAIQRLVEGVSIARRCAITTGPRGSNNAKFGKNQIVAV